MAKEKVAVHEVAESAKRIIIRLDIGGFEISGPHDNIVTVESLVAFGATVNELYKEGYDMVPPEEYASVYGLGVEQVYDLVRKEGSLFLISYQGGAEPHQAVPLQEKRSTDLGPHLL